VAKRAEDYLGEQLAQIGRHPGPYQDAALRFARHALAAFREIGLVTRDEAEAWDARLGRAAEDPTDRPPAEPEARAAAHRYLERLLADLRREPHELAAHARLHGAIRALADIGALSAREAAQWNERAFPPPPDPPSLPKFEKTHVVQVLHGPEGVVDGLQLTLIARYTDGVTLNWTERPTRLSERTMRRIRDLFDRENDDLSQPSLTDDVGTDYVFCGGSGAHGSRDLATIGASDFAPAPPPAARLLVFESLGREIRIRLDG
jgi:hypothetical protein